MNYLSIAIKPEEPDDEVCPALVTMVGEKNNLEPWATWCIYQCIQRMRQETYLLGEEIRSKTS